MALLAAIGPVGRHVGLSMALYAAGFLLLVAMLRRFPGQLSAGKACALIFVLGAAARAAFLFYPPNTDIYRYIWEGAIQWHGFNPYSAPPSDPALAGLAQGELAAVWTQINHRDMPAIYPPGALLLCGMLAALSPTPVAFKVAFAIFDLGVIVVLAGVLRRRGIPPARLLVYAANPLVIVFVCGEGHIDVLQVFFLVCACWGLLAGRCTLAGVALGLSVMAKYLTLVAVPFFWTGCRRLGFASVLLPAALLLPYLGAGSGMFASLARFGSDMQYNAFLADWLGRVLPDGWAAAAALALLLCCLWVWLTEDDPLRAVYLALGCVLLLLPTVHPWYLALIVPLTCLFPSRAWLWLQAATLFTFPVLATELRSGVFREIPGVAWLEYLPFFALAILGLFRPERMDRGSGSTVEAGISIVVPTLNEAATLGRCLDAARACGRVREIIVADGGSSDGTRSIAQAAGAALVTAGKGRGVQLRAGAARATGDILLFLHADSILKPDAGERIVRSLERNPAAAGGCLGMRFEEGGWVRRGIAILNNLRVAVTGIGFGDQAQFVRRDVLERIGGFPGLMLMEDVELSLRLKRFGRPVYLPGGVVVSGRRWQAGGSARRIWLILTLFIRFLTERRLFGIADGGAGYYRRYYGVAL